MAGLLHDLERVLAARGIAPSRFGRDLFGDPRIIFDMRRGREPGPDTRRRILAWLEERKQR